MISDDTILRAYKQRALKMLNDYQGIEARDLQLVSDFQMSFAPNAKPEDVRQAFEAVKNDGNATKRLDDHRGWVWRITPDGHRVAAALNLED